MTEFHVAIDHLASPYPDAPEQRVETTYLGTVDQAHADEVRAIAALDNTERWVKEHPRLKGAFMVLRDDGDLDVYVPVDAAEYRVYEPDPEPKRAFAKGGTVTLPTVRDDLAVNLPLVHDDMAVTGTPDMPRGASGPAYIDGVVRLGGQAIGGAMDYPGNPPRTTWHTTESPAGKSYFYSVAAYLTRVGAEPQVIYDPVSDLLGQFGPLTKSGRALRNDGTRRTNREGKVNIQVEVLGRASQPWTKDFDPAVKPNFRSLLTAARAHGIPDVWPAGKPGATAAAVSKGSRSRTTWQSKGGHYGHCHVPGNDHWDPGAIDTSIVPGTPTATPADPGEGTGTQTGTGTYKVQNGDTLSSIAKAHGTTVAKLTSLNTLANPDKLSVGQILKVPAKKPAPPRYEPFPGETFFHGGRHSPVITAMGKRLVAEGCGRYNSGPGPNWTNADRRSYAAWQQKLGYSGTDADGIPGKASWDALKVPNV